MNNTIIQILPNLGLVGGTAAKVRILAEKSKFNHVICYADNSKNSLYKDEWLKIKNIKLVSGYSLSNPIKNALLLVKLCKSYNCHIIHSYFPIDSVSSALAKILYPKIKIIRSFEGVISYSYKKRIIQNISFLFHSRFLGISNYVERYYREFFKIPNHKIRTIYNCPAFEVDCPDCNHYASNMNLLSIGGLNPTKNTETLVEAVKILKERGIAVVYHVLGDGPLRSKVEKIISDNNLENEIVLHGFKSDVTRFLKECSIYVHPANCEGFGMAVVEAMSYKCPVLVSDSCALPELIENGVSGYIIPTYDAVAWANKIEELLKNQGKIDSLGNSAYKRYEQFFSVGKYVTSLDNLYFDLIKNENNSTNQV